MVWQSQIETKKIYPCVIIWRKPMHAGVTYRIQFIFKIYTHLFMYKTAAYIFQESCGVALEAEQRSSITTVWSPLNVVSLLYACAY